MTTTLDDLLTPLTVEEIFQLLLAVYQSNGFPVQSWQTGGVERTRLMAMSTALLDVSSNWLPDITAGGFLDYATGDWLKLLAKQMYNIDFNPATFTVGNITLSTVASAAGPYNYTAGQLIAVFAATGNRYINTTAGTLAASTANVVEFRAEFAGADYNDPSSSGSISLVTSLPGVVLTNPAEDYSDVAHVGSGTGTIALSGTPVGPQQVLIVIDSTGASTVASWSYSINGGVLTSAGAVGSYTNLGGTGIDLILTNGLTGTSFVEGDTYLFSTPGSWITTQGADEETTEPASTNALATRCRDRWATLSPIPVTNLYEELVLSTPDVGSQVTQVIVLPDTVINNKVNIVVAGPEGALPVDTVADIQEYVEARVPITDLPYVVSPGSTPITVVATVTCSAALLSSVQSAITVALDNYIAGVGINGTIRLSTIVDLIMEITGVIDIDVVNMTINGSGENLTLGSSSTFYVAAASPTLTISYITE